MSALSGLLPRARLGFALPPPFPSRRSGTRALGRASHVALRRRVATMTTALSSSSLHDVVVVGNGPIGSAVARHVAETGASVLVVDGKRTLTSASDDMGRIVRPLDAEGRKSWTDLNVASIDAFPAIEAASGVTFFRRCGSLACGTPSFVEKPAARLSEAGAAFDRLDSGAAVAAAFPFLSVPDSHVAVSDQVGGFVDPHRMIEAQNALTFAAGDRNEVVMEAATEIREDADGGATVITAEGGERRARAVVLAGGSYTTYLAAASGFTVVAPPAPDVDRSGVGSIRLSRRTVLLAEVTEAEARGALAKMPTVKYQFSPPAAEGNDDAGAGGNSHSRNEAMSVYVLPPIEYPGPDPPRGWYVKIGGGANDFFGRERWSETVADLDAWMKSDGDDAVADRLHDVLLSLMPRTNFLSLISKPCVTTCTDDGELQVETMGANRAVIAVGGCQGKAAGPADAVGKFVATEVSRTLGR